MSEQTLDKNSTATIDDSNQINANSIKEFIKNGFNFIMEATKCSNAFPSGPTRDLYSAFPTFNTVVNTQSNDILNIISQAIKLQKIKGNIQRRDIDEQFELLLEYNDTMLERISSTLDDISGIRKYNEPTLLETDAIKTIANIPATQQQHSSTSGSWNVKKHCYQPSPKTPKLLMVKNIVRPQLNFTDKIDNDSQKPFKPKLNGKPNAMQPFTLIPEYDENGDITSYIHPYEYELIKFDVPKKQLRTIEPIRFNAIENTPLILIDSMQQLKKIYADLKTELAIGVDLEHHSYRTFQGITCLLQISTRSTDYIIDTLCLRNELQILNEIFTNPNIVKIFHGADSDVEWLQRDLGIYVVNMFDTHQAAKRLGLARLSLQFLVKFYCQIDVDKTYQLADWRVRPLPEELIAYAREDTHYLLYIFDLLTNELIQKANGQINLLQSVYQSSTELCKKLYIKPKIFPDSYIEFYRKSKRVFDNKQLYALNAIYEWRDKIARDEDESYGYVLPNHMLLQIAENLPREIQGILACCNPIPPLVRQNLQILHQFVLKAREQPLVKLVSEELSDNRTATLNKNKDLSCLLFCPHDLLHNGEFRDDLPTVLGYDKEHISKLSSAKMARSSSLTVFNSIDNENEKNLQTIRQINQQKFVSPYARYVAMLPFAEKQRLEELAKQQEKDKKRRLCPEKQSVEEFIIKTEPDDTNVPFKDYGKRKHNDTVDQVSKKQRINESDEISENQTIHSEIEYSFNTLRKGHVFKNKKNQKKVKDAKRNQQSSNKPIEFNYSQIDYNQFQGGSTSNLPSKKGMTSKKKNFGSQAKKYDKYLTFNKSKKKK